MASAGMTAAQLVYLRRALDGSIEGRATALAALKILAASALLGLTAYGDVVGDRGSRG